VGNPFLVDNRYQIISAEHCYSMAKFQHQDMGTRKGSRWESSYLFHTI